MTIFLSHLHADLRRTRLTRRGATHDPKDVPRGTHKEYPRMERHHLPTPQLITAPFLEILEKRNSSMAAGAGSPLTTQELGTLFGSALARRKGDTSRNYPSGGALYPIETYLVAFSLSGLEPGVFHYHPTEHALERMWEIPPAIDMKTLVPKPDFLSPTALVVFTSVWKRSSAKYGDFTYTLALLEAGHMSENLLLVSAALGLETRPMAGFNDNALIHLLDLNDMNEQPVHSITIARGDAETHHTARALEE